MTQEELNKKRRAIQQEARERELELCNAYAYANNTVKVGDIISDSFTTICVKRMRVHVCYCCVEMQYLGPELTKAGAPRKDRREGCVYQSNIIKK